MGLTMEDKDQEMKNSMQKWITAITLLLPFFVIAVTLTQAMGCRGGQQSPPAKQDKVQAGKISLETVLENPQAFAGKEIVLEGVFRGWNIQCPGSTPMTRSDWVLEDETACIYVTGRIPDGISTIRPKGERLILSGRIKIGRDGKPVLEVITVKKIPQLPK